jgi:hypothetical protein
MARLSSAAALPSSQPLISSYLQEIHKLKIVTSLRGEQEMFGRRVAVQFGRRATTTGKLRGVPSFAPLLCVGKASAARSLRSQFPLIAFSWSLFCSLTALSTTRINTSKILNPRYFSALPSHTVVGMPALSPVSPCCLQFMKESSSCRQCKLVPLPIGS